MNSVPNKQSSSWEIRTIIFYISWSISASIAYVIMSSLTFCIPVSYKLTFFGTLIWSSNNTFKRNPQYCWNWSLKVRHLHRIWLFAFVHEIPNFHMKRIQSYTLFLYLHMWPVLWPTHIFLICFSRLYSARFSQSVIMTNQFLSFFDATIIP